MIAWLIVFGGSAVSVVILGARSFEAAAWRRRLSAYQVTFSRDNDEDSIASWFASIAAVTHRPLWSVLPLPPVAWEVVSTSTGIAYFLLVSKHNADSVLSSLRATIP